MVLVGSGWFSMFLLVVVLYHRFCVPIGSQWFSQVLSGSRRM